MKKIQKVKVLIVSALSVGLGFAISGLGYLAFIHNTYIKFAVTVLFVGAVVFYAIDSITENLIMDLNKARKGMEEKVKEAEQKRQEARQDEVLWKQTMLEKCSGFPSLVELIGLYEKAKDDQLIHYLLIKSHPSLKGSEVVKEEAARRRKAENEYRQNKAILDYYENIAPFLIDLKDDVVPDEIALAEYTEEEKLDPVINFLTKEEYRKLSPVIRNQMALDRFWQKSKSKWLIGRLYERYVGYIFEKEGYDVEYVGIFKGYEDLGRDLICQKGNEFIIIQCKNWSQFRTIYEKHIFQFFGTVFQYRDAYPDRNVKAAFFTSTKLSDLARRFASELDIHLKEEFKFDKTYPCIKCNINKTTKEKIYHLPFDQQYDNVKIEPKHNEFYASTVTEAEKAGFRRAFKWHGNNV